MIRISYYCPVSPQIDRSLVQKVPRVPRKQIVRRRGTREVLLELQGEVEGFERVEAGKSE